VHPFRRADFSILRRNPVLDFVAFFKERISEFLGILLHHPRAGFRSGSGLVPPVRLQHEPFHLRLERGAVSFERFKTGLARAVGGKELDARTNGGRELPYDPREIANFAKYPESSDVNP